MQSSCCINITDRKTEKKQNYTQSERSSNRKTNTHAWFTELDRLKKTASDCTINMNCYLAAHKC